MRRLVWFSCGAASAALALLAIDAYGDGCQVVYCDTMSAEHADNARFFADVERWIGRKIEVIRSAAYVSVDDVIERRRYMAGIGGAACTTQLKKLPREAMQRHDDVHLFGYTVEERKRAEDFEERNQALNVEWLLIENGITKADCHAMIAAAGIAEPAMYTLGYEHNNCLGCVKSTSAGYWNKIRRDFPWVFEKRAHQSRLLGVRLVRWKGVRIFLDELPIEADAPQDDIDCGPVCQLPLDFGGAA